MSVSDDREDEELLARTVTFEQELSQSIGRERELNICAGEFQVVTVKVELVVDCTPNANLDGRTERNLCLLQGVFSHLDGDVQNFSLR